jgi:hypothetical protein
MTTTASIAPPADSADVLAGLPPLLGIVPQAGPPLLAYAGFSGVLLLLLVPPLTLVATLIAVAPVVAAALATLVVLVGAMLEVPFLLVRVLRDHRPSHFALRLRHVRELKVRRV